MRKFTGFCRSMCTNLPYRLRVSREYMFQRIKGRLRVDSVDNGDNVVEHLKTDLNSLKYNYYLFLFKQNR